MFSCGFCEISKNTFFYRTLLVAVSVINWRSSTPLNAPRESWMLQGIDDSSLYNISNDTTYR